MKGRTLLRCVSVVVAAMGVTVILPGCCLIPPSHPPVAENMGVSTNLATAVTFTLVATDPRGDPLTYTVVALPSHGVLDVSAIPTVTYTPDAAFVGCDSFTFQASDGTYTSNVATVSIAVGLSPTTNDADAAIISGEPNVVRMSGALSGGCPVPLSFQIVTTPSHGSVGAVSGSTVTYTPATDYTGPDQFTFRAYVGTTGATNDGTARINVYPPTSNRRLILKLQNETTRYIHYNLILIAFREDIVPGDEKSYTDAGYVHYPSGTSIGCYSFTQDLYLYYHMNGRFRESISNTSSPLYSGIRSATNVADPAVDTYWTQREIPVPSVILFHDPSPGNVPIPFSQGRSAMTINPLLDDVTSCIDCGSCAQASWYYVQPNDTASGFTTTCSMGRDLAAAFRYFRVPAETQDTACYDCIADAGTVPLPELTTAHWLHNSAVGSGTGPRGAGNVTDVRCYEFYMNSIVTYTFTKQGDITVGPTAPPSLVWDVRTRGGQIIHVRRTD